MSVKGGNYETVGPSNNGRSALCRRLSSIRLFAAVCVRLAPRSETKLNPHIYVGNRRAFTGNTVSINGRCPILRSLQRHFQLVNLDINGRSLPERKGWIHLRHNMRPFVENFDNHVHVIIAYHVEQIFRNRLIRSTRREGRV
jgi:hypothetical protein